MPGVQRPRTPAQSHCCSRWGRVCRARSSAGVTLLASGHLLLGFLLRALGSVLSSLPVSGPTCSQRRGRGAPPCMHLALYGVTSWFTCFVPRGYLVRGKFTAIWTPVKDARLDFSTHDFSSGLKSSKRWPERVAAPHAALPRLVPPRLEPSRTFAPASTREASCPGSNCGASCRVTRLECGFVQSTGTVIEGVGPLGRPQAVSFALTVTGQAPSSAPAPAPPVPQNHSALRRRVPRSLDSVFEVS